MKQLKSFKSSLSNKQGKINLISPIIKCFNLLYVKGHNNTRCGECIYADDPHMELVYMGLVSLGTTIMNIISISLTGSAILKLKEYF